LDTNILARLLLRDDDDQYQRAVSLLGDGRAYTAPPTVILELVWVLGNSGVDRRGIIDGLKALLNLPNFRPRSSPEALAAVGLYEAGLDFADALHLMLSDGCESLITFDARFAKRATRLGATPAAALG
jgi:predicted nucleic acid-binding protein